MKKSTQLAPVPAPLPMTLRLARLDEAAARRRTVSADLLAEAVEIARHYQEERHALEVEILKCIEQVEILAAKGRKGKKAA